MHPSHFVVPRPLWLLVVSIAVTLLLGAYALSPHWGSVAAQGPEPQAPQVTLGTGFTYQGQLKKNNTPVNDNNCSMTFSLWDLQFNGSQLGSNQAISPVAVANGLFTVVLNGVNQFGASAFTGQDRWLQAAVQCAGDGSAVTLSRQRLTAAPYALFSAAPWATSGSNVYYNAGNVGIGTAMPNNKLTVSGAADIASFLRVGGNTGGAGIAGDIVARRTITTGAYYFGDSANNYLYFDGTNYRFGQGELYVNILGKVGIGTGSPDAKLEVQTSGGGTGVFGSSNSGVGVWGFSTSGDGVIGASTGGNAGNFIGPVQVNGPVTVTGYLAKSGGGFLIDHPLDPANQYLNHSFVESPDMKNVYDGNATLDANGQAGVILPDYFEALNRDFRYQLTALGAPGPNLYIAEEIQNNRFKIAGGKAGAKVSWQVTGIRQDPWAEQNRRAAEMQKAGPERGKYLYPQGYGQPDTMGVDYEMLHPPAQGAPGR